jgi:thiol:disulfide interchange protein DsbD
MKFSILRQVSCLTIALYLLAAGWPRLGASEPGSAAIGFPAVLAGEGAARPTVSLELDPPAVTAGQSSRVIARLDIPPGMHLVKQPGLLDMGLAEPRKGVSAGPCVFPPPSGRIAGTDIYNGAVRLELPLEIGPGYPGGTLALRLNWQLCQDDGVCLRPVSEVLALPLPLATGFLAAGPGDLALYLALAVLGGLLLNVMPCVLPVLSLKALALTRESTEPRVRRRRGLAMVAGILASLLALALGLLALRAGGQAVGWGFQFQSPWYTLGLAAVVLSLALSLLEVWNLPQLNPRMSMVSLPAGRREAGGLAGNFGSGFLTVLLATPCTAPFLGTALGFALAAPPQVLMLIFLGIGIGLALPFALVVFLPAGWLRQPKPGPWLDRFRELMALALLATVVWLLSVLLRQTDAGRFVAGLWFLLGLALLWRLVGWVQLSRLGRPARRWLYAGLVVAGLALGWLGCLVPAGNRPEPGTEAPPPATGSAAFPAPGQPAGEWRVFGEAAVAAELAAGHAVFIDFTAAWCLSCQINEAGALADPRVLAAFRKAGASLFRGDYTNPDPVISAWLSRYRRAGVPFYLLLRADRPARVLPELLVADDLVRQLETWAAGTPP